MKPPKPTYSSADTGVSDQEQKDHIGQGQLKDDHQGKRVKSKKKKRKKPFLRLFKFKSKTKDHSKDAKSKSKKAMLKETEDIIDEEPSSVQKKQSKITKDSESSKDLPSDEEDLAVSVNSLKTMKSQLGSEHEDVSPSSETTVTNDSTLSHKS